MPNENIKFDFESNHTKMKIGFLLVCMVVSGLYIQNRYWVYVESEKRPLKRSENGAVSLNDKLYVVGGRGQKPVDRYDPVNNRWDTLQRPPLEMHHFQALNYKNEMYIAGAFTGPYPHEKPIENIYIFNPKSGWRLGEPIPENRRRGAAGLVSYKDKLYLVCGIVDGHYDGNVSWFDEFDPKTKTWKQLPDAPRPRDHFQAVVVDNKLYVMGGRTSSAKTEQVFQLVVPEVDVYDFKTGTWSTLPPELNLPTLRAGCTAVVLDKSIVVMGGESPQVRAHSQCESFDTKLQRWTTLDSLNTGRHGTQAAIIKNKVYLVAGSANRGGGPEQDSMECFKEK